MDLATEIVELKKRIRELEIKTERKIASMVSEDSQDKQLGTAKRIVINGETYYIDSNGNAVLNTEQVARLGIGVAADATAGLDARNDSIYFGAVQAETYLYGNSINFTRTTNGNGAGWINYYGYNTGITQYRDLHICNGKGADIVFVDGSAGSVTFSGPILNTTIKSGATQPGTCVNGEIWKTASHATLPDNTLMIAVV